jgi:hypothetical protein
MGKYVSDAEEGGNQEVAQFFRAVQQEERRGPTVTSNC